MPFATETMVRQKFQMTDSAWAPASLLNDAIQQAHTEILRRLHPDSPIDPPADALLLGETLLAGAYALHTMAAKDVLQHKEIVVGGQRLTTGNRFAALIALAERAEKQAWAALEPHLIPITGAPAARTTDSMPVFNPANRV